MLYEILLLEDVIDIRDEDSWLDLAQHTEVPIAALSLEHG